MLSNMEVYAKKIGAQILIIPGKYSHNMFEIKAGSTTARPRVYTIESDNETEALRFGPAPDTSYTGYLSYYKSFGALSDTNTSNYILNKHPGIYLYGSLYHAANFLGGINPQQVQTWQQMFATAMERLELNDREDEYNGSPLQVRTVTSVPSPFISTL